MRLTNKYLESDLSDMITTLANINDKDVFTGAQGKSEQSKINSRCGFFLNRNQFQENDRVEFYREAKKSAENDKTEEAVLIFRLLVLEYVGRTEFEFEDWECVKNNIREKVLEMESTPKIDFNKSGEAADENVIYARHKVEDSIQTIEKHFQCSTTENLIETLKIQASSDLDFLDDGLRNFDDYSPNAGLNEFLSRRSFSEGGGGSLVSMTQDEAEHIRQNASNNRKRRPSTTISDEYKKKIDRFENLIREAKLEIEECENDIKYQQRQLKEYSEKLESESNSVMVEEYETELAERKTELRELRQKKKDKKLRKDKLEAQRFELGRRYAKREYDYE